MPTPITIALVEDIAELVKTLMAQWKLGWQGARSSVASAASVRN
jgi:hypothetical protein